MAQKYFKYPQFPGHTSGSISNLNKARPFEGKNYLTDYSNVTHKTTGTDGKDSDTESYSDMLVEHSYHSSAGLKPNVVRIEVLSPTARRRYLNGGLPSNKISIQSQQDLCKQVMIDNYVDGDPWLPFYGIIDMASQDNLGFSFAASWGNDSKNTDAVKQVVSTSASVIGKAAGAVTSMFGGAIGGLTGDSDPGKAAAATVSKVGEKISSIDKSLDKVIQAAASITDYITGSAGLNYSTAGAATVRTYSGSTFSPVRAIKCKWYMPEQGNLARLSIGRLVRMAYSRGMNTDLANPNENKKLLGFLASAALENITDALAANNDSNGWVDSIANLPIKTVEKALEGGAEVTEKLADLGAKQLSSLISDVMSAMGYSFTVDPLPVRLTIGHVLDIEPLVITNVDISCSKEQFVSEDGSSIPLFVTATISFEQWMMPNPNTGFIQFMGDPLFKLENSSNIQMENSDQTELQAQTKTNENKDLSTTGA